MSEQTVLVTGAGSGIGAAVALAAARQGAGVAVLDINAGRLERVTADAAQAGGEGCLGPRGRRSLRAGGRGGANTMSRAPRCSNGSPRQCRDRDQRRGSRTLACELERDPRGELDGRVLTAKYAIREMLRDGLGGSVVCTSSPSAFVGFAGGRNAAYAASKGGISAMVRSLALDYASAGIRVNGVVPGATDTPLLTVAAPAGKRIELRDRIVELAKQQVPLGRLGTPDEVANAVLWLWSDAASYVTGSHLVVDGGVLAKSANDF